MRVNAPEKIYRTTFYLDDDKGDTKWKKTPVAGAENIEYIRKDAFIEKACEFFDGVIYDYIELKHANVDAFIDVDNKRFIDDFKKYMEESKV